MLEWFLMGGVMMGILLITSIVAIAIIFERFLYYREVDSRKKPFLRELYDCLDVHQLEAAEDLCKQNPCPLSHIVLSGLSASDRSREDLREILTEAGSRQVPKLEANLNILSTIAYISPLLGLLGTVLGMITAFQKFQDAATAGANPGPGLMAEGIWQALITTVAGLSLGISVYIVHNYLYIKKERAIDELEGSTQEVLEILTEKGR